MHHKEKNDLIRMLPIKCSVTKTQCINIVEKFAKSQFFIGIYNVEGNDFHNDLLTNKGIKVIDCPTRKESMDIIARVEVPYFSSLVDLLLECKAEVIVFYFSNANIAFEQFSMKNYGFEQRTVISQGLCSIVCTWATNNYELFFHYDATVFPKELREDIKKCLTIRK